MIWRLLSKRQIKWEIVSKSVAFLENLDFNMMCAFRNFQKILMASLFSTYDKWNFRSQISSIFHFDRVPVSNGQMSARFLGLFECHTISWKIQFLVTINFGTVPSGLQFNRRLQSTCYKWTVSRLKSTRQISARNSSPLFF